MGSGDVPVRAFFAVELGAAARDAAARAARALRAGPGGDGVRWVRPENLHVTLRFLGDVEPARIPALVENARAEVAARRPFRLRLSGPRAFPSERRPRVIVLAVEPEAPLAQLAAAVERGVAAAGFAPEERPFRAHLTLGRVQGRRPRSEAKPSGVHLDLDAASQQGAIGTAFEVREVVLLRSELGPSGSRYTPLERIGLSNHPLDG